MRRALALVQVQVLALAFVLVACDSSPMAAKPQDIFADRLVAFAPGSHAGFGQDKLPAIVLGSPHGAGDKAGSLHVVSLGNQGTIVVAFDDLLAVDGVGPDLVVFENAFTGFVETGAVAASMDGQTWHAWPCQPHKGAASGCAGQTPVYLAPEAFVVTQPFAKWGGDAFDLGEIGLKSARYIRITDSGANDYEGITGGFDLDAVAVINSAPVN